MERMRDGEKVRDGERERDTKRGRRSNEREHSVLQIGSLLQKWFVPQHHHFSALKH